MQFFYGFPKLLLLSDIYDHKNLSWECESTTYVDIFSRVWMYFTGLALSPVTVTGVTSVIVFWLCVELVVYWSALVGLPGVVPVIFFSQLSEPEGLK